MLQVITCQDIIGWRENALHILVYLSDAEFHFAGDGKLGGVVIPHDGQCYLEQRGDIYQYTMAETLDYPSVGHISSLLQQFNIIPIFAIQAGAQSFYEDLRQFLDFAFVGTLSRDSSNIIDLIQHTYADILQTVTLLPTPLPDVRVEITPMCENVEGSTCTGVSTGQTVSFSITLTTSICTDELINGTNWIVKIPGFGQFEVELTGVCDCSCVSNPCQVSPDPTIISPELTALPPVVYISPAGEVVFNEGARAEFICFATGVGAPDFKYQWFLNNKPVAHQDTRTLIVTSVSVSNTGDYTCSILSPYEVIGRSNNTATLILERYCNPVTVNYIGFNITWNETQVGITVEAPCTGPRLNGFISRRCILDDQWNETINCFREETGILLTKVINLNLSLTELNETDIITEAGNIADLLTNVTSSTEEPIFAADINLAVDILSTLNNITETIISNLTADNSLLEDTVSVINNLLSDTNQNNWEQLERTSPATSQNLISNAEQVTTLLSVTLTNITTEAIKAKPNIVLKAERVSNETFDDGYVFPDEDDNLTAYTGRSAQVIVPSGLLQEISGNSKEITIASILIRDDTGFRLPSSNGSAAPQLPVSPIFSLQIDPIPDPTALKDNPIMMMFDVALFPADALSEQSTGQNQQNFELDDLSCNFYDSSLITDNLNQVGGWSTEGLILDVNFSNKTSVTCLTTHLTSFAVLVSIQDERPPSPADKALSIISYIGCSISLVCLCISIIFLINIIYKSKGKINHLFVHLNLCIALALGLIVFIAGIESATGNEVACKVVAALLQYFFISAFCWMLSEGVMLYMMLVTVFDNKLNKQRFFVILGWGPAIPIVAISAGIAHEHYGTDYYCWIQSDDGAIAAFIVPIVVIMLINCVFLAITLKVLWASRQNTMNKKVISNADTVKDLLKAVIVLLPVLGLTWIIGIIAVNNETQVFAWIFAILNSLQGVFIFIFHVLRNKQVAEQVRDCFTSYGSGSTSTFGVSSKAKVSQNSSSEVSDHNKKILTTSFGGGIGSGDHLSSSLDRHLSKDKSEVIENSVVEDDNQIKLTTFKKLEESITEEQEKQLLKDNCDIEEDKNESMS